MPNKRMIHTKIWVSNQFNQLKPLERLLYIGMITLGDYHGRLRGDANYLRRQFFYQDKIGPGKIAKMRDRIAEVGLIEFYSVENGEYIFHPNWMKYQTLDARSAKPSDFPPPESWEERGTASQKQTEVNSTELNEIEANERKRKIMEQNEIDNHIKKSDLSNSLF